MENTETMEVMEKIPRLCGEREEAMIRWRRDFHRHPELSYRETRTSSKIQEELSRLGIPFDLVRNTDNAAMLQKFGVPAEAAGAPLNVVARIEGTGQAAGAGAGAKKFALRADFDALPVREETALPFKSETDGVMHACGHDAHAAMLLGAAGVLQQCRAAFAGTVYLCFQSAEEIGGGSPQIVDYLRSHGGVDGIAALHIWGSLPAGRLFVKEGPTMSGLSTYRITAKGRGGHGSRPDLVRDPIKALCDLTLKMASIPSNFYDVLDNCAIHTGVINGGTGVNIFPETAQIAGGARYFKKAGNEKIREAICRMAEGVGKVYGVEISVDYITALIPVVNDRALATLALRAGSQVKGLEAAALQEPIAASDNFCYLCDAFPGLYAFLGGARPGESWEQHNSHFDIDESVLVKGCEFLCRSAVEFLGSV